MFGVFIGDELSAAGFRLAGLEIRTPVEGHERETVESLIDEVELMVLTADIAAKLPIDRWEQWLAASRPLLVVIPDVRGRQEPEDFTEAIRSHLGIGEEVTKG